MNNPENGPGPEDLDDIEHPPHIEPQLPVETPRIPERRANWFQRLWRHRPVENPQIDEEIRALDTERQQGAHDQYHGQRQDRAEHIDQIEIPRDPDDLVEMLGNVTVAQWRERKLNERYGAGGWGRFRAFMAGEFDFTLGESGQVEERNLLNAFTRRALRAFGNKQVLIGAAAAIGIGALTGGLGIPAVAAVLGTAAGRGVGEGIQAFAGKEGQLREEIARVEYIEFRKLQEMALASQETNISTEERNHRLESLINSYNSINEAVVFRQRQLIADDAKWNKVKKWCGFAGGVAGFALSAHNLMNMDIDGNGIAHQVSNQHGQWAYAYNNAAERGSEIAFAQAHNYSLDILGNVGQFGGHVLNESTATVVGHILQNAAPAAAAVIAGAIGTHYWEKNEVERRQAAFNVKLDERRQVIGEERDFLNEQVPHGEDEPPQPGSLAWCRERFGEENMPARDQIWILQIGFDRQIVRITDLNFAQNQIQFEQLTPDKQIVRDENNQPIVTDMPIHEFADVTFIKADGFTANWLNLFGADDRAVVEHNLQIENHVIPAGEYQIVKVDNNPGQVLLRRVGQTDIPVPAFALAFYDVRRLQPEQPPEQERLEEHLPDRNDIFRAHGERNTLPPRYQDLPAAFVVQEIDARGRRIFIYDQAHRNIRDVIAFDDWPQILGLYDLRGHAEAAGGGGNRRDNRGNNPNNARGNNPANNEGNNNPEGDEGG